MPGGRTAAYRNTGDGDITPVSSVDLHACKGNLTIVRRNIEWRGSALDITNSMQRKAVMIYTHGVVVRQSPCMRCVHGSGPFKECVVAFNDQGYIANGVCANCYWLHRTDVCGTRHNLPCQELFNAGLDLGEFEEVCKAQCGGIHIRNNNALPVLAAAPPMALPAAPQMAPQMATPMASLMPPPMPPVTQTQAGNATSRHISGPRQRKRKAQSVGRNVISLPERPRKRGPGGFHGYPAVNVNYGAQN
ncbi:hypothetical protein UA08_08085 [Talaromyces atroroseus]|uniref:Uncharacterized protein n=1 Tax=Talaromyces atroroseus TaxID=1441469 RepID=A0A225AEV4_TALAT|nr:hypothetical protein UA08_08085 [Talaromyces atroroseus]OKL56564.1 hypothetical protein UA08_08085 [Talaromyces atroroseus]